MPMPPPSTERSLISNSIIGGNRSKTVSTTEDQWLRFFEKLTPSRSIWSSTHWLEFFGKPVTSHQLTRPREFSKIFVHTIHDILMGVNAIYVLDLDAPSNIHKFPAQSLNPAILFSSLGDHLVFVILGYKLYMFGGWSSEEAKWLNNMSIYDMRKALSSPSTIDLTDEEEQDTIHIETGPEMAVGKHCPVAAVIGEFRICVFGASLYLKHKGLQPFPPKPCFLSPNFEVYDTRTESWVGLPEPIDWDKCKPMDTVFVKSYCVYLSSLIIETNIGIFGINLDNPNLGWVKMEASESIKKFPFKGMWKSVHADAIGRKDPTSYPVAFRDSTNRDSLIRRRPSGVLCLGGVNSGSSMNLCSVRGGLALSDGTPHLLVDIVKCGAEALKNLISDCPRWKEIQSDKSFSFAISCMPSEIMKVIGCYPLKEMDTSEDSIRQKKNKETKHM